MGIIGIFIFFVVVIILWVYVFIVVCESLSCVWLFATPWTVARQSPLSIGFSRQEYWSRLPCPPPGDVPDPGIRMSGASLLSEGTYLQGLSPLYVSLLAWILKSLYRSLNRVQSYILSDDLSNTFLSQGRFVGTPPTVETLDRMSL